MRLRAYMLEQTLAGQTIYAIAFGSAEDRDAFLPWCDLAGRRRCGRAWTLDATAPAALWRGAS